jgi:drug/metabolite transporter (DMT)-like permease
MTPTRTGILIPLAAMVLFWALTPISIAWIKDDFSLIFQVWLRYCCSAAALWLLLLRKRTFGSDLHRCLQEKSYYVSRLSVTALCTIMFQLLYTWCFMLIPPGFGVLLYQSQVIFSVVLGIIFFSSERQLIRRRGTLYGIATALVGAVLVIVFQSHGFSVVINMGILLALGGALSWSLVGITVKLWVGERLTPLFTVTVVFTLVTMFLVPVVLMTGPHVKGTPSALKWIVLVGSGLLGIAGGQALFYYLLPVLGVITASSAQLLVPFLTAIFSYLLFGEGITVLQSFGGIMLLGGCQLVLMQKRRLIKDAAH